MNLLSLVGPRLNNICQIRRKWYYSSNSKNLQSERAQEADFGLSCPFLLSKVVDEKKYSAARLWQGDSGHRIYTIDHLSVR